MKRILLIPLIIFALSAKAQNSAEQTRLCGTMQHLENLKQQDPTYESKMIALEQFTQNWIANNPDQLNKAVITVPVVVHIVGATASSAISDARVQEQIDVLNRDYAGLNTYTMGAFATTLKANTELQFCLAKQDPTGLATTGIERRTTGTQTSYAYADNAKLKTTSLGGLDIWDHDRYMNIWVTNLSGGLCGYAEFPVAGLTSTFGVAIHYQYFGVTGAVSPYNLGGTTTHEIGHCFNLYHIWGDDGTACTGTDNCADTPNQAGSRSTCPTTPGAVVTDACTTTSPGIMYMNFMDYSYDACYANFTPGQKARIQACFATGGALNALTTSNGCSTPGPAIPIAAFTGTPTTVSAGGSVTFTDQSLNTPTSWSWSFPGAATTTSTLQNPVITYNTPGTYNVTLIATNSLGSNTLTKTAYITVCGTVSTFPYVQNFENAGVIPSCWTQQLSSGTNYWTFTTGNGGSNPAAAHGGTYNALLQNATTTPDVTYLVTPSFNLTSLTTPKVKFWHTQAFWSPDQDELRVYYKTSAAGAWTLIQAYTASITTWTLDSLTLPNPSADYYIGFQGTAKYAYGVCLDDVTVYGATSTATTITTGTITGSPFCAGASVSVPFTKTGTFNTGNVFTAQLSDASGSFTAPVSIGTITGTAAATITATIPVGTATGTGYRIRVIGSNPATTGTANTVNLSINALVTPVVSIAANPTGSICSGTSVTFTATATNGGSPTYQWRKNGTNIAGATNSTYTTTTLVNADAITCRMVPSLTCLTQASDTSNTITMVVNSALPASVAIAASPGTTLCSGTTLVLTATATNGGTPTYQWKKNTVNIPGATNSTYSTTSYANADVFTCVMTSSLSCATGSPATSNSLTLTVNTSVASSVSIASSAGTSICSGASVTFTATPVNGGTPTYEWKKNGVFIVGATNSTYTTTTLVNNDAIACLMTSSLACASGSPATSNTITMTVSAGGAASVAIAASPGTTVCTGTSITFSATPTNGGTPLYQWKKNTVDISGATNSTYTTNSLVNGDAISCQMTSSLACATGSPATSNSLPVAILTALVPNISVAVSDSVICQGDNVSFTTSIVNGGSTPSYQWYLNGNPVSGATNSSISSSNVPNGAAIYCIMTSSESCANPTTAQSTTVNMIVNPLPAAPVITEVGNVLYSSATSGNQWYNSVGPIFGETGTSYSPSVSDNYYVIVMDANGCISPVSNSIYVTISGIEEKTEIKFEIIPNPNSGEFTLTATYPGIEKLSFSLYNVIGEKVFTAEYAVPVKEKIQLTGIRSGMYYGVFENSKLLRTEKIIINK